MERKESKRAYYADIERDRERDRKRDRERQGGEREVISNERMPNQKERKLRARELTMHT